jgi:DNA-binding NarL/FixJ family response regulator
MTRRLGVHSELDVPLDVQGERRGAVQAASRQADFFTERDLSFLASISCWIGIVTHRSELFERATAELRREGRREAATELTRITRREREVASLIAEGLTNAEIAETLVLTEGTVANHLEHVLRKLRLRNRTQVATWAVEHGLYRTGDEDPGGGQGGPRPALKRSA